MSIRKNNTRGMRFFEYKGYWLPRTIERYKEELAFYKNCPSFEFADYKCLTGLCEVQANRLTKFFEKIDKEKK